MANGRLVWESGRQSNTPPSLNQVRNGESPVPVLELREEIRKLAAADAAARAQAMAMAMAKEAEAEAAKPRAAVEGADE